MVPTVSLSTRTQAAYERAVQRLHDWSRENGFRRPSAPNALCAFIQAEADRGMATNSIVTLLAGIAHHYSEGGRKRSPTYHPDVVALLDRLRHPFATRRDSRAPTSQSARRV